MISVRHIHNTLTQRDVSPARLEPWRGYSIADYAPDGALGCLHNDAMLPRDRWAETIPSDGDTLNFVTTHGGDAIGDLLGTSVRFTAAVLTLGSTEFLGLGKGIQSSVSDSISQITSIFSPSVPSSALGNLLGSSSSDSGISATYGFGAPQNQYRENQGVPIVYGEHLIGGLILMQWSEADGNHNQILRTLIGLSEGPIEQVGTGANAITADTTAGLVYDADIPDGITLAGSEANSLREIGIAVRMGTRTQTLFDELPEFKKVVREYGYNYELTKQSPGYPFVHFTKDPVEGIFVNLTFPSGIFRTTETGEISSQDVRIRYIVYRRSDDVVVYDETRSIWASARSTYYHTHKIEGLPLDKYYIEVMRTYPYWDPSDADADEVEVFNTFVSGICEADYHPSAYRGMALLAVEVQATEQISGSRPRILAKIKGRKVYDHREAGHDIDDPTTWEWSSNPALCARDLLTAKTYGLGRFIAAADIDIDAFDNWADYCDVMVPIFTGSEDTETRHRFDCVFDSPTSTWDAFFQMCQQYGAKPTFIGDEISVAIVTNTSVATQLFTKANIITGSDSIVYIGKRDIPNVVEVTYRDSETFDPVLTPPAQLSDLQPEVVGINKRTADTIGIKRLSEANRYAYRILRGAILPRRTLSFSAGIDSVAVLPGGLIKFTTDIMRIGVGGRYVTAGATTVTLDQTIPFEAGKVYVLEEVGNDGVIYSKKFSQTGTTAVVNLAPQSDAPHEGKKFLLREEGQITRTFEVIDISFDSKLNRQIRAVEFVPEVYTDDSGPAEDGTFSPETGSAPDAVTGLAAIETYNRKGVSDIAVSWTAPAAGATVGSYDVHYRVYSFEGGFTKAGSSFSTSFDFQLSQPTGIVVEIAVVAVGLRGERDDPTATGIATVLLQINRDDIGEAIMSFPAPATNLALTNITANLYALSWTAGAGASGYVVRRNIWHGGALVAEVSSTSCSVYASKHFEDIIVRAYKNVTNANGDTVRYYSPEAPRVLTSNTGLSAYPTEVVDFPGAADYTQIEMKNGVFVYVTRFFGFFRRIIQQVDPLQPVEANTGVLDAGSNATYFLSLDPRIGSAIVDSIRPYFWPMKHVCPSGIINEAYVSKSIWIEYSASDANLATFERFNVDDSIINSNIILTGRYFRLVVRGEFAAGSSGMANGRRIIIPFIGFKIHSA